MCAHRPFRTSSSPPVWKAFDLCLIGGRALSCPHSTLLVAGAAPLYGAPLNRPYSVIALPVLDGLSADVEAIVAKVASTESSNTRAGYCCLSVCSNALTWGSFICWVND